MKKTLIAAAFVLAAGPVLAAEGTQQAAVPDQIVDQIRDWADDPAVVEAINAQNAKTEGLSQGQIDDLDKQWRAETSAADKPLINEVTGNALSAHLSDIKEKAGGLYNEIFVMDAKGLNVGQSDVTSDYWQGDEAKWQKTFQGGPDAVLVDEVEFDESTQSYQSQVSVPIADPATKTVIGAITVGVNVDAVE